MDRPGKGGSCERRDKWTWRLMKLFYFGLRLHNSAWTFTMPRTKKN